MDEIIKFVEELISLDFAYASGGDVYFDMHGDGHLPDTRLLPSDAQVGEVIAMLNTGAYTMSQMTSTLPPSSTSTAAGNGRPL